MELNYILQTLRVENHIAVRWYLSIASPSALMHEIG